MGVVGLGGEIEKKNPKKREKLMDTDSCVVIVRGSAVEGEGGG